jgi:hypothetical protein
MGIDIQMKWGGERREKEDLGWESDVQVGEVMDLVWAENWVAWPDGSEVK